MTLIESILINEGPMVSSDLARKLAAVENISPNTASQRISRNSGIGKIGGFFKSGQSLVFLKDQVKEGLVYPALSRVMQKYGEKYWHTLNAIAANGGSIDRKFLECYTNYPISPLASHIPFDDVMKMFVQEGILVYNQNGYAFSPKFHSKSTSNYIGQTLEQIKISILEHFASLSRNTGIISYETGELFGEYAKFRWGFKGLCPVMGLRQGKNFGYVVADILIGRPIYDRDVSFFLAKLAHVQSYNNAPRLLPYLLVDNLHPDALHRLKEKGVIVGFINELFGEKYAEILKELIAILKNVADSLTGQHPDKYLDLIKELRKYNKGLLNNIKGALFEYMVGHLYVMKGGQIEIGREIYDQTGRHEIDVKSVYYDRLVFAECKGTRSPIEAGKIDEWIKKKVPAFQKWFADQDAYNKLKPEFEYWSTSGFTEDAMAKLIAFKNQGKCTITINGPDEIRKIAGETNNKKLKEALDTFFLRGLV